MIGRNSFKFLIISMMILTLASISNAQRRGKAAAAKPKPVIFAIINNGERIEPIGEIDKGELVATAGGDADEKTLNAFSQKYYKPKTTYNLIFGAAKNGTVTVVNSNPKSDCGKNAATVKSISGKAKLSGLVMALATNETPLRAAASGVRRLPTPTERAEIESLVRAEFIKQGATERAAGNLKYHNLTALDVNNDGTAELVGTFWLAPTDKERNLLFFIAEKNKSGKYGFGYSKYEKVTPDQVMSNELKDLDENAMVSELLLDALEYNGDTTAEIFTVVKAFEGYNYNAYSRDADGKWTKVYEGYNYHCAY